MNDHSLFDTRTTQYAVDEEDLELFVNDILCS